MRIQTVEMNKERYRQAEDFASQHGVVNRPVVSAVFQWDKKEEKNLVVEVEVNRGVFEEWDKDMSKNRQVIR